MLANPLKPLILGMFAMVLVMGAVGLITAIHQTAEDQQALAQQARIQNTQVMAEVNSRRAEGEKSLRVRRQPVPAVAAEQAAQRQVAEAAKRPIDVGAALVRLEILAAKGDPIAQSSLGAIHEIGLKPSDFNFAPPAAWILGRAGFTLFGEPPRELLNTARFINIPTRPSNERLAGEWYLRAALQGDAEAQYEYARHLSFARTDPVESAKWYLLADFRYVDKQGRIIQGKRPEGISPWVPVTVTPEQRAEAERRAKAFVPTPEPKK